MNQVVNQYIKKETYTILKILNTKYENINIKIDNDDVEKCKQYLWNINKITSNLKEYYYITNSKVGLLHRFILNVVDRKQIINTLNEDIFDYRKNNLILYNKNISKKDDINKQLNKIRKITKNNELWFVGVDVAKLLGYKNVNNGINSHCSQREKYPVMTKGGKQNTYIINKHDVCNLISGCTILTEEEKILIIKNFGVEDNFIIPKKRKYIKHKTERNKKISKLEDKIFHISTRKETKFLKQLCSVLEPFNILGEKQYKVLSYRIDYYIPKLNIAIEYDEYTHKNYTYEQQEGRQALIEKELGCKFIRVSDDKTDIYNVGLVLKEMFQIAC